MNYACLLLGATFIFAVGYWYAWGRRVYVGPRVNVELVQEGIESETSKEGGVDPSNIMGEKTEL
jgi:hypothetical protein